MEGFFCVESRHGRRTITNAKVLIGFGAWLLLGSLSNPTKVSAVSCNLGLLCITYTCPI